MQTMAHYCTHLCRAAHCMIRTIDVGTALKVISVSLRFYSKKTKNGHAESSYRSQDKSPKTEVETD